MRKPGLSNFKLGYFCVSSSYTLLSLIMLAKTSYMTTLLQNTNITKKYLLETSNIVEPCEGIIELGIEKDPTSVIKRYTTTDFINSKTLYKTLYQENHIHNLH